MSRYRPTEKPGSQFITPAGAARLKQELDELWRVERPRVTQAVSEAAAQGDRSENAEYTYGKKRLHEIDKTTGEKWEEFKQRSTKALDDLGEGIKNAWSRFK